MLCFTFAIVESDRILCVTFLKFGEECTRNPIFCNFFPVMGSWEKTGVTILTPPSISIMHKLVKHNFGWGSFGM